MYDSSGTYPTVPPGEWLTSWSAASESSFTISNTGAVVLQYGGVQYAGVDQFDLNLGAYNTMHVDLWTPNANQFGIQLVSIDNGATQAAQVNYFPASGAITSNQWVSLDIPLYQFTSAANAIPGENASPVDLSAVQQLLWIDNQGGGGVTGGIFYLDNIYFYAGTAFAKPSVTAALSNGGTSLSFPTEVGGNYAVLYKTNLTDASWQTLTNISGNNAVQSITDSPGMGSRYYLLKVSPQ
jgi:hypothetical protein